MTKIYQQVANLEWVVIQKGYYVIYEIYEYYISRQFFSLTINTRNWRINYRPAMNHTTIS